MSCPSGFTSRERGFRHLSINQIKRLAAFQNPEFYKKQNLRLSTALTPRVISCAEDHEKHISLPRGCLDDVQIVLQEHESHLELEDLRHAGDPIDATFFGELTEAQHQAAKIHSRARQWRDRGATGFRKNRPWHLSDRPAQVQHLDPGTPTTAAWNSGDRRSASF